MGLSYCEWRPGQALRDTILALWCVEGDGTSVPSPTVLPDAYIEIVINLGDPVMLSGPTFTGLQPNRVVVGLLNRAIPMQYRGRVQTFGIRLHPARAARFLAIASERLADRLTPLAELSPRLDRQIADWVRSGVRQLEAADDRSALEALLEEQQHRTASVDDRLVVRAVDRFLTALQPLTVARLATELGVTPRHLHRRFVATVGTPPKRLERLARFARTWQQATMDSSTEWASLAYANGYADQAHLVREFRAFGATPPAHLFTPEWYEVTSVHRGPIHSIRRPRPRRII